MVALIALALLKLALHLLTNRRYGYFRDELYYMACGDRLSWGYIDHPPAIPLLVRVVRELFGDSLFAIRLAPALAGAAIVFLTGWMARRLGAKQFGISLAALAALVSPAFLAIAAILTVNVFDILWWTIIECLLIELILRERPRLWIWIGLVFGVGILTKYNIVFLAVGLFAAMLLTPARKHLRNRWTWLGVALALAIFSPNVIWQISNHWPTLEFLHNIREFKNYPVTPFEFVSMQFIVVHPLVAPIWCAGLCYLLFSSDTRTLRVLGVTAVAVFLIFLLLKAKFYYLFPIYPVLFASGGVAIERFLQRKPRRWPKPVIVGAILLGTGAFLPYTVPVLSIDRFLAYDRALSIHRLLKFEKSREPSKPIVYADMFGWPELATGVARVFHSLPTAERQTCTVLTNNYGEASAIKFFGGATDLPQPVSGHNSYYLWGSGERPWETVIAIGFAPDALSSLFENVELVETLHDDLARETEIPTYVCSALKMPLRDAWLRLKHFR